MALGRVDWAGEVDGVPPGGGRGTAATMSDRAEAAYLLPREKFVGEVVIGEERVPIRLIASAGESGRLELDVEPVSITDFPGGTRALKHLLGRPGDEVVEFRLACESQGGKRLKSDQAYLTGYNYHSDGLHVGLSTNEALLEMTASETRDRPVLRARLPGFKCFPLVQVKAETGSFFVEGAAGAASADKITGSILFEGAEDSEAKSWRVVAERMLMHVRSVLGFARGARLSVPVTEFYDGDAVEVTFHDTSPGHVALMPPLSHLNLESFLATAVANLDRVDAHRDSFETAIGWFLVPTAIDEVWFLTGMTALESLASRTLDKVEIENLNKAAWSRFAKQARAFVDGQEGIDETAKAAIKEKIPELSRRSFSHKIRALLLHWNVSRVSVSDKELTELVALRNAIVHQGGAPKDKDLWSSILLIREILVRIILSMLGFEGMYQCYIGGRHQRWFPDCER